MSFMAQPSARRKMTPFPGILRCLVSCPPCSSLCRCPINRILPSWPMRAGSGVLGSIAKKSQQVSLHKLRLSPSNCTPSMGSPRLLPCWVPGASQRLEMFTFFPWLLLKVWPTPLTGQTPSLSCTCLCLWDKARANPSLQLRF